MKRLKCFLAVTLSLSLSMGGLTSCSRSSGPTGVNSSSGTDPTQVVQQQAMGDVFLNSGLKIRSVIQDSSVAPAREIVVELYVDAQGNGEGMLGFGDIVRDVKVVRDILYIIVDDDVVVSVSDITGRLIAAAEDLSGVTDMTAVGFQVVNSVPVEYNAKIGTMTVATVFAQSNNTFTPATLATDNVMTLQESIVYIIDYYNKLAGTVEDPDDDKTVESFYLSSPFGVEIDGGIYSVGDTCNPDSYFGGRTPEGLLTSTSYKEDTRVDFLHVSYISDTGRTSFTLTGDYVQGIETQAAFKWLDLEQGMDTKTVQYKLGWKLSKKDVEVWTPMAEELTVTDYRRNTFYCEVGSLKVELRCESNGGLKSIYIERPLDYVPK